MNTKTIATLAMLGAFGLGGAAWAADAASDTSADTFMPGIDCPGPGMMRGAGPDGRGAGFHGRRFDPNRELTADQVRVLTQAHLIRMGDDDQLKVGEVHESTAKTYTVQLLKTDGTVARTIELGKNGMPLRGGLRMQQQQ
ncbi:exported hypothetical protein [uncultured Alphaproteobacteria bacterium]|uniref:PepSY domain-containing protein n=1 Tax=uncultured Alphaproteobacteria bacterium TaxID=91750 RepID=A0A212JHJ6_9PROT|nr:exported hypothetical protein [uncultured Alphaproteobacteria bacterium]